MKRQTQNRNKEATRHLLKVTDFIIAAISIAVACISFHFASEQFSGKSSLVFIKTPYARYIYPLDTDGEFQINGKIGVTVVKICNSKVKIIDSPCDAKTCIHSPSISKNGQWIACMPNGILVSIKGKTEHKDSEIDILSH